MMTGEIKKILIEVLQQFVKDFQERRAKIDDKTVEHFMSTRKIEAMPKAFLEAKADAEPSVPKKEEKNVQVPSGQKERTFIMIKPDGVQRGLIGKIVQRFEKKGFKMAAMKICQPGKAHLEQHYADLKKKPFFPGLIEYMNSGPVCCMVWEGDNAVLTGRKMLGATKPFDSAPGTIRGDFCIDVGRNICHGSDSVDSANNEIKLWFKNSEVMSYKHHSAPQIYE
jgi:nucleoside-diphosphate kinase